MSKYVIGAILIILVIAVGSSVLLRGGTKKGQQPTQAQTMTSNYSTSTFSVTYPSDYTVDAAYVYDQVNPKKPISGVKFTIPGEMATGTNLSSDTYLSVEWLPRAKNCTGDIYLAANIHPHTETTASTTYSVATSSGAGAGNLYEEMVYAVSGSKPCTAVRYFIHSGNIDNYPEGTVRAFDRTALLGAFDKIRQFLVLNPTTPTKTP